MLHAGVDLLPSKHVFPVDAVSKRESPLTWEGGGRDSLDLSPRWLLPFDPQVLTGTAAEDRKRGRGAFDTAVGECE